MRKKCSPLLMHSKAAIMCCHPVQHSSCIALQSNYWTVKVVIGEATFDVKVIDLLETDDTAEEPGFLSQVC